MRTVRWGVLLGVAGQVALLAALAGTVGLGRAGWLVGLAYGGAVGVLLEHALRRSGAEGFGPAHRVTLTRATLVGGVAALVAGSAGRTVPVAALGTLAVVALVLDAVDGRVARRTGTVSAVGARFDMEVDAFLILVLSVLVARSVGPWVLAIGAARYLLWLAERILPWLRRPVPPRYWRKVVAAVQGIVLTAVALDVLAPPADRIALAVALVLLAESFGRDVWRLARTRRAPDLAVQAPVAGRERRVPLRRARAAAVTALAVVAVWGALLLPDRLGAVSSAAFVRIPVEGLVLIGLLLVLPRRVRPALAVAGGVLLGLLSVLKLLDMGFHEELGRRFDPTSDWGALGPAVGVLRDSVGRRWADLAVVAAGLLVLALVMGLALSVVRVQRVADRRRRPVGRAVGVLGLVWALCAVLGAQLIPGVPVASRTTATLAADAVRATGHQLADQGRFERDILSRDPYRAMPASQLLTGLRGKDVIVAFVESYGQVAVQDSVMAPGVDAALTAGTQSLQDAGFSSRSAFLRSPTFGGISWLAHSTLQSGLWVDSQRRYDQLVTSDRFTLSDAFLKAGWRTVSDVPSNEKRWPEGRTFYHFQQLYDQHNVGYAGPKFAYASMPDQYTLDAFRRLELGPGHAPVFAEIDLVSSHTPWTPLPHMVPWDALGDGSVFDGMQAQGITPADAFRDPARVQDLYGKSIQYSMNALVSWVTTFPDPNLVLVLLGDHQPSRNVSGEDANHDSVISVVAHDPAVMDRISGWGWSDGLLPARQAPVWPMDAFRNRFLGAFGPSVPPSAAGATPPGR